MLGTGNTKIDLRCVTPPWKPEGLKGDEPRVIVAGQSFWKLGSDVVRIANRNETSWSRFLRCVSVLPVST